MIFCINNTVATVTKQCKDEMYRIHVILNDYNPKSRAAAFITVSFFGGIKKQKEGSKPIIKTNRNLK